MTAPTPTRRFPLLSAVIAILIGIVIGLAGMFAVTSMAGQAPTAQATTPVEVEVLEYGTR
jgi:hypothetical protein